MKPKYRHGELLVQPAEVRAAMLLNFLREVEWILNAENNTVAFATKRLLEIDAEQAAKLHAEALAWIKRLQVEDVK